MYSSFLFRFDYVLCLCLVWFMEWKMLFLYCFMIMGSDYFVSYFYVVLVVFLFLLFIMINCFGWFLVELLFENKLNLFMCVI